MKTLRLSLLIAIILSISIGSLFAGGFALSGIGSKAISLGGAFRGMANDPTAMYWNPAGLGFMEHSMINLSGAGIMPVTEFTNTTTQPGFDPDKLTATKKLWLFPNLYALKGGECKFKYGLGVYVPYGLGAEWDAFDLYSITTMPVGANNLPITWAEGFEEKELMSSIGMVDIHPTFSYMFSDKFSAGFGVSVMYGMIEIKTIRPNAIAALGYMYPTFYLPTAMELEGTGMGYGGNLGIMFKPVENLSIGISGKIPIDVNLSGELKLRTYMNSVLAQGAPQVVAFDTDADATMKLPADIGMGWSMQVNPNWNLNMDVTYTMWDRLDKVVIEFEDDMQTQAGPVSESEMVMNWENTYRVSVGTEYRWPGLALRAGFFFDETPIPDGSLTPILPDTGDKYSANVGWSYNLGKFIIDLNYEHMFFKEREIVVQTADNMIGTYNNAVDAFNFGLTYPF